MRKARQDPSHPLSTASLVNAVIAYQQYVKADEKNKVHEEIVQKRSK
jgi:hypothetical protein